MKKNTIILVGLLETATLGVLVLILLRSWYPDYYYSLFEVAPKFYVFVALLLMLGPILGRFVYKADSVAYLNDLSVIYLIKFCVVFLALHYAYSHRPVLTVFSVDRFVVVQAHQIPTDHIPVGLAEMVLAGEKPPLVAARKFSETDLSNLLGVMGGEPDIEYRPNRYERIEYQREKMIERLCSNAPGADEERPLESRSCDPLKVPLIYSFDQSATAVFDLDAIEILKVFATNPWQ
ncbi:hypothetical protein [Marinobacter qingdaonensis]|uniref:Uncharacterized protein n=1 Tax=Marinobacter qingdaonensis TaxID=3108486 RepID=A0ABU5P020_9GAMM|nr:hypothetical protein [Marinobacter sp. ASW11-75]MEA1081413.1 hypothetical protein [Marinobacter sp. ASW11-75]